MAEIDILGGGITGLSQYMSLGVYNIGRDYASEAYKQPQTGLVQGSWNLVLLHPEKSLQDQIKPTHETDVQDMGNIHRNGKKKKRKRDEERLLTGSNSNSSAGSSLRTASTQSEDVAQPAETQLVAVAVKVGVQGAGSIELADLSGVRWVPDSQEGLQPAWGGGDRATVHPDVEAGAATVSTVATLADTTEGQGWNVQRGVVAGNATRAGGRYN